ncbi:MAG: hypothetical protein Unbinned4052contig1001_16 [Prokaryotic dsDNA virus sp.]|nr:MAG: hypothetical protein Unbinned4052contig1001_16 [Prokaryotic dsDNA virus sp.]
MPDSKDFPMTKYATGNPVLPNGSADPRDLFDNAQNLDVLVNSQEKTEHPDRLGVPRKTWHGMEQDFQQFLVNSGYTGTGAGGAYEDYDADGPLTITALNQLFTKGGEFYRLKPDQTMPYITTTWATDEVNMVAVGDAALRQELAAPSGAELVSYEGKSLKETLDAIGPVFKSIASAKLGEFPIEGQRVHVSSYYSDWAMHAPYHPAGGGEFVATAEADQEDGLNVYATATPGMFLVRTAVDRHTPQMMGLGLGRNAHEGLELSEFLQLTKRAYFPKGEYPIDAVSAPLTVPSDTDVEAHKEAKFSTLPNSSSGLTKTIAVENCSNVRWQGGVAVGERYDHTGTDGEFGHGIYIGGGASNVKFIGVESSDFWGDGWYVGNADATTITNVTIEDCIGDGNRRQGLSITSGIGVNIIRGHYRNTNGTAPAAGIDIEPNVKQDATQYVRKLLVDGVRCYGNAGGGLLVAVAAGSGGVGDGGLVEGKIVNCFAYENGKDGFFFNETSWLTAAGNHSFNNGEWGYNCSVGVKDSILSANQARNNPSGCFNLNNGCDRVTLSGNRGGGGEYLIKAYNCDELRITDCHLRNAETALQLDQCRGYNVSASSFKDCPYVGVLLSNPDTSNGMIVDNSFHNCGSHATEVTGRAYGAVICAISGASANITNMNRFTWDSGKSPANSIYYVRSTTTIKNKFVHDVIQDRNMTKLRTEGGPAEPNNEVVDINDLFTYPL